MASDVKLSRWSLLKGVGTTVGAYGAGRVVRLAGSIALARLLTPELFGIIAIVNSVRTGIDLHFGCRRRPIHHSKQERRRSRILQHRMDPKGSSVAFFFGLSRRRQLLSSLGYTTRRY